jgi:hypothetical protein
MWQAGGSDFRRSSSRVRSDVVGEVSVSLGDDARSSHGGIHIVLPLSDYPPVGWFWMEQLINTLRATKGLGKGPEGGIRLEEREQKGVDGGALGESVRKEALAPAISQGQHGRVASKSALSEARGAIDRGRGLQSHALDAACLAGGPWRGRWRPITLSPGFGSGIGARWTCFAFCFLMLRLEDANAEGAAVACP